MEHSRYVLGSRLGDYTGCRQTEAFISNTIFLVGSGRKTHETLHRILKEPRNRWFWAYWEDLQSRSRERCEARWSKGGPAREEADALRMTRATREQRVVKRRQDGVKMKKLREIPTLTDIIWSYIWGI